MPEVELAGQISARAMRSKRFLMFHRAFLLLVLPLVLYYIYRQLQDGWDKLESYRWSLNLEYLFLSILVALAYLVFGSWIWHRLLFHLGSDLPFWKSYRVLQLGQMGKYLPGLGKEAQE